MTPAERAEKIAAKYCLSEFTDEKYLKFTAHLAAQIEEAERDMRKLIATNLSADEVSYTLYKLGFAAAREKAAGIVDRQESGEELCAQGVAERIRLMEPEK